MDVYGGPTSRVNSIFAQQTEGVPRQWSSFLGSSECSLHVLMLYGTYIAEILVEVNSMIADAQEPVIITMLALVKFKSCGFVGYDDWWSSIPYSTALQVRKLILLLILKNPSTQRFLTFCISSFFSWK